MLFCFLNHLKLATVSVSQDFHYVRLLPGLMIFPFFLNLPNLVAVLMF